MTRPTHAIIDGKNHVIVAIEDAGPNSAHSHRVKFACGMLFDLRGEHQFEEHRADHDDELQPHSAKHLAAVEATRPAMDAAEAELTPVSAEFHAKLAERDALRAQIDSGEPMEPTEEDYSRFAKLTVELRRLRPKHDKLLRKMDETREAHAAANEAMHRARKGRDRRWLTQKAGKPVKVTCETCAGQGTKGAKA